MCICIALAPNSPSRACFMTDLLSYESSIPLLPYRFRDSFPILERRRFLLNFVQKIEFLHVSLLIGQA